MNDPIARSAARCVIPPFVMAIFSMVLLMACTEKPTLTLEEKTRFVAELIAERGECVTFRQTLAVPAASAQALNDIYEAAKKAFCLKPDV